MARRRVRHSISGRSIFSMGPIAHDDAGGPQCRRASHLLPRYRQRLTFVPFNLAHATLEDDPEFDIRRHIKFHMPARRH